MMFVVIFFFFFFSSRRRHTRLVSDWSSDVCSSDLAVQPCLGSYRERQVGYPNWRRPVLQPRPPLCLTDRREQSAIRQEFHRSQRPLFGQPYCSRSEERRVGKGCR